MILRPPVFLCLFFALSALSAVKSVLTAAARFHTTNHRGEPHERANPTRPLRPYGGQYVPETLMVALRQLSAAYEEAKEDPAFQKQFHGILAEYVGRPSRLYFARRLTEEAGGAPHLPQA